MPTSPDAAARHRYRAVPTALSLIVVTLLSLLAAAPAHAASVRTSLPAGASMAGGDRLVSPQGGYTFDFQTDGNGVVYGPNRSVVWTTGTPGHPGAILVNQGDGNLVIYDRGRALWNSGSAGTNATYVVVQDDGNLVKYFVPKENTATRLATWSSFGAFTTGYAYLSNDRQNVVNKAWQELANPRHVTPGACNVYSLWADPGLRSNCTVAGQPGFAQDYCAQFVRWVYGRAAVTRYLVGVDATAASVTRNTAAWHPGNRLVGARPGDLVGYRFNGPFASQHVGILVSVSATTITTIEGNTSIPGTNPTQYGVALKTHPLGWADISGYSAPLP